MLDLAEMAFGSLTAKARLGHRGKAQNAQRQKADTSPNKRLPMMRPGQYRSIVPAEPVYLQNAKTAVVQLVFLLVVSLLH